MTRISIHALAAIGLLVGWPAAAKTYRWVDENGVTVYSQSPPKSGRASEIKPPPPPAVSPEEARRRLDRQRQRLEDLREDRALKKEEAQKQRKEQARRENNCAAARGNLKRLIELSRARWKTPDGDYVRLPEQERQKKIETARKQIEEYCK